MELIKKLAGIQSKLNAPKGQFNKFGKYNYRNCEDILQAVKPLLDGAVVLLTDDIVQIGDRFYVKATAKIMEGNESIEVSGFARECISKKGMDDAQLTGSCSSYSRKYALNGLFLIDDNKDADSMDNSNNAERAAEMYQLDDNAKGWIEAARKDNSVINQIDDLGYRNFIQGNL